MPPQALTRRGSPSGSPQRGAAAPPAAPARPRRSLVQRRSSVSEDGRWRRTSSPHAGAAVAARSRQSFPHRDFANPEAETCWLSCLFQALWHSAVFHAAFERDLASPAKYLPGPDEPLLAALQHTWAEYATRGKICDKDGPTSPGAMPSPPPAASRDAEEEDAELVPARCLAEGFGEGYGDMSDALACIQTELSESSSPAAVRIADLMVLVPVTVDMDSTMEASEELSAATPVLPDPATAWRQAEEWQATAAALIAVDIAVAGALPREQISSLASLWVPKAPSAACVQLAQQPADLGAQHHLMTLVCFMWHLQHYVAFCRRQSEPSRCLFFNDLPELTRDAPRDLTWSEVPDLCSKYGLTPRLAFYESHAAAADMGGA